MKRFIMKQLIDWKKSLDRKPFILKGGKTGRKYIYFKRIW